MNYPRGDNDICFRCNKRPVMDGRRCCSECYAELLQIVATLQDNNNKRKQIENQ